jgi:hypothetical protein
LVAEAPRLKQQLLKQQAARSPLNEIESKGKIFDTFKAVS